MAEDTLVGKDVTVRHKVTEEVSWTGEVVADDEKGILLRRTYRKGVRLEHIPRDLITSAFCDEKKSPGRRKPKLAVEPATTIPEEPDETEVDDLEEGFGDELPDLAFEDDDE